MSIIASSRPFGVETNDDFISYYENYWQINLGNYDAIFTYSNGVEVGLPLLHVMIATLPAMSPSSLIFTTTLISGILFALWLELYVKKGVTANRRGLLAAAALLFYQFTAASQLTRQFYSLLLVLFALSSTGIPRYLFIGAAPLFHLSAIPVFVAIAAFLKLRKLWFLFLIPSLGVGFVLAAIPYLGISWLDDFLSDKYGSAYDFTRASKLTEIQVIKLCLLSVVLAGGAWMFGLLSQRKITPVYFQASVVILALGYALLPYYLMATRLLLLFHSIALGVFIFLSTQNLDRSLVKILLTSLLVWRLKVIYSSDLWEVYPPFSFLPFYYLG